MRAPKKLVDWSIRRKLAIHKTKLDRFTLRLARTLDDYRSAFALLHAGYVYQGIEGVRAPSDRLTAQHLLPEANVILVHEGRSLVATMTVTLDSPAGLALDKDFPNELAALRAQNAVLVEYGSLAIVARCWGESVTNLMNIFAHRCARGMGATHCVIGVNPRAFIFYRAVYNFTKLADSKSHASLAAPVVGLVQDMADFERIGRQWYRIPMASGLLPIEHFQGAPLPCIDLPQGLSAEELIRLKLPREVFQELLKIAQQNKQMSDKALDYLRETRTHETMGIMQMPQSPEGETRPIVEVTMQGRACEQSRVARRRRSMALLSPGGR